MVQITYFITSAALVLGFVSAVPTSTPGLIARELNVNGTSAHKYDGPVMRHGLITTEVDLNGTSPWEYEAALEKRGGDPSLRTRASYYACTEANWKGTCWHSKVELDATCMLLSDNKVKQFSSIGPDMTVVCEFYDDAWCTGNSKLFNYPGHPNLAQIKFDKKAWSVRCWFTWEKGV